MRWGDETVGYCAVARKCIAAKRLKAAMDMRADVLHLLLQRPGSRLGD
jgi:hypothetical protein